MSNGVEPLSVRTRIERAVCDNDRFAVNSGLRCNVKLSPALSALRYPAQTRHRVNPILGATVCAHNNRHLDSHSLKFSSARVRNFQHDLPYH